jgi:pentatricopeptide repeat protein
LVLTTKPVYTLLSSDMDFLRRLLWIYREYGDSNGAIECFKAALQRRPIERISTAASARVPPVLLDGSGVFGALARIPEWQDAAIMLLSCVGRWEGPSSVDRMRKLIPNPDDVRAWNILVQSHAQRGNVEQVMQGIADMDAKGLLIDNATPFYCLAYAKSMQSHEQQVLQSVTNLARQSSTNYYDGFLDVRLLNSVIQSGQARTVRTGNGDNNNNNNTISKNSGKPNNKGGGGGSSGRHNSSSSNNNNDNRGSDSDSGSNHNGNSNSNSNDPEAFRHRAFWRLTEATGYRPTTNDYNSLLRVLRKQGLRMTAWLSFKDMKLMHIAPDTATYNCVLSVLDNTASIPKIVREMRDAGVQLDAQSYVQILNAYSTRPKSHAHLLDTAVQEMLESGIQFDRRSLISLMRSRACEHPTLSDYLYSILAQSFKEQQFKLAFEDMWRLVYSMSRRGLPECVMTIHRNVPGDVNSARRSRWLRLLLEAHANDTRQSAEHNAQQVEHVLNSMVGEFGTQGMPDSSIRAALRAFERAKDGNKLRTIYKLVLDREKAHRLDSDVYNALLIALANVDLPELCLQLLPRMVDTAGYTPTFAAIDQVFMALLRRDNDLDLILTKYQDATKHYAHLNQTIPLGVLHRLLEHCSNHSTGDIAIKILNAIQHAAYPLTVWALRLALKAHIRCGGVQEAEQLMHSYLPQLSRRTIQSVSQEPQPHTSDSSSTASLGFVEPPRALVYELIKGYADGGELRECERLWAYLKTLRSWDMHEHAVSEPSPPLPLLKAAPSGVAALFNDWLVDMHASDSAPSITCDQDNENDNSNDALARVRNPRRVSYHVMLIAYAKLDYPQKVFSLFAEMKKNLPAIDPSDITALLRALEQCGTKEDMLWGLQELRKLDGIPDVYSFNTLIRWFGTAYDTYRAENMYKRMLSYNIQPNRQTYAILKQLNITPVDPTTTQQQANTSSS